VHAVVHALNDDSSADSFAGFRKRIKDGRHSHDLLSRFGFIQIKKFGGSGVCKPAEIEDHVRWYKQCLTQQVELYDPVLSQFMTTCRVSSQHVSRQGMVMGKRRDDMPTLPLLRLTLELLSYQDMPRVRSENPFIAAAIASAVERSLTFEQLLASIQGTDGLVYVEEGLCGHGVRACLSLSIKMAGPFRLLRIRVDRRGSECALISSIGHELQHAIEVLSDPHVTDMHLILVLRTARIERPRAI
jgi:hypothetical protein